MTHTQDHPTVRAIKHLSIIAATVMFFFVMYDQGLVETAVLFFAGVIFATGFFSTGAAGLLSVLWTVAMTLLLVIVAALFVRGLLQGRSA